MWNYVFFLLYLKQKPTTEYTGTEQYIYEMTVKGDISWFPLERAMILESRGLRHQSFSNSVHVPLLL